MCDRGILEQKAYTTDEEFTLLMKEENLSEVAIRESYDAVFHLVTAAKGAEEFYTLENNATRTESAELAREMDDKTLAAWVGHSKLKIVDNSTDFSTKMDNLMKELYLLLGQPVPNQIQKKYLVSMPDIDSILSSTLCTKSNIVQTYIMSTDKYKERRIRQRGTDGDYIYTLTEKVIIEDSSSSVREKNISQGDYISYLANSDIGLHQIRKNRFCFVDNNRYFELDVFPFSTTKALLEVKLTDKNDGIELPSFINVLDDVTDNKNYSTKALASIQAL